MEDPITRQLEILEANRAKRAAIDLQEAKLKALQDTIGNYGNFRYVDLKDFIDPDNQNWYDYKWSRLPAFESAKRQEHVNAGTPVGMFIQKIRDAENQDDVKKQLELWNSYKPLDSYDNGRSYIRYFIPGFAMRDTTPSVGSRPVQTTAGGTGGAQGVVTVGGAQGTQTGAKPGNAVAGGGVQGTQTGNTAGGVQGAQAGAQADIGVVKGGVQGSNNGSGGTQGTQGVQAGDTGGTYASSGVPKGGTKTIGYDPYDPNPGNVSLAYVMRNAPEQERRAALINKWNRENGRESVPYVPGTEIPAGSLNRSSSTYASPGISSGGMYATGEGIKDANGNVLTNPGGDWEYQYALKNPQYGLGMMGKMSDAQKEYLQAVSDDMGYKYNFKGANRFV